jgi:uncharacterized repeat protein (TIGR04052 family)
MTIRRARLVKPPASWFLIGINLVLCAACSAPQTPVNIEFVATWAGQSLRCSNSPISLTDLRFFVSDIVLIDTQGATHPLSLTKDSQWQQERVALVDLENGSGACLNGTNEVHAVLSGTAEKVDIEAIQFTVGVPFELNHGNPLLASPPLNDAAMHWHWRSGYKFLRAGVATKSDGFWIHLGSTGCEGTVQNISGCRYPNRVTVELSDFNPDTDRVAIDLSMLIKDVDIKDGVRSDCSSGLSETSCVAPFDALGLSFGQSGGPTKTQSVFQVTQ